MKQLKSIWWYIFSTVNIAPNRWQNGVFKWCLWNSKLIRWRLNSTCFYVLINHIDFFNLLFIYCVIIDSYSQIRLIERAKNIQYCSQFVDTYLFIIQLYLTFTYSTYIFSYIQACHRATICNYLLLFWKSSTICDYFVKNDTICHYFATISIFERY